MATITGTNGADTLNGTAGNDTIDAKRGDDLVDGIGGDDYIEGGDGNDTLFGDVGNDTLRGEKNDDSLDGGIGDDSLDGGSGDDVLIGGDGNDELLGVSGDDSLDGGSGDDTLKGGSGDDNIDGGTGADIIEGGSGHDTIAGGDDDDDIDGGSGHDLIAGGDGNDSINGGSGQDTVVFAGSIADFTVSTTGGLTTVTGSGAQGTDTVEEVETLVFDDYTLDLTGGNNAPVALEDAFVGDEDTQITGNVLADNGSGADYDFEGDALSVTAAVITTANGGTVNLLSDGSFTYDPAANYHGPDSFSYTLSDGSLGNTGTVSLTVNAVNDAPEVQQVGLTVDEADGVFEIDLRDYISDPDTGDVLSLSDIRITRGSTPIAFSVSPEGVITIDPSDMGVPLDTGEVLATRFSYTVTDDSGATNDSTEGMVDLTINGIDDDDIPPPPANTGPTALAHTVAASEGDGMISIALSDIGFDPDAGDVLTVTALTGTLFDVQLNRPFEFSQVDGNIVINPTQFFTQETAPVAEVAGDGTLSGGELAALALDFTIEDAEGETSSNVITLNLTGVDPDLNHAPVAVSLPLNPDPFNPPPDPELVLVSDDPEDGATHVIDLSTLVSDVDVGDVLTITPGTLEVGFDEGTGLPITVPYELVYDTAEPANVTGIEVTLADFGLADGENVLGILTYSVSDGSLSAEAQVVINYTNEPATPPGPEQQVLDFEPFATDPGSQIVLPTLDEPLSGSDVIGDYEGFIFQGSATVYETDELAGGDRGGSDTAGISNGQTTAGGDNVLVGTFGTTEVPLLDEFDQPVLDRSGDPVFETVPDDAFAILAPGSTHGVGDPDLFLTSTPGQSLTHSGEGAFNLDGLSLNLMEGTAAVTVTTYGITVVEEASTASPGNSEYSYQLTVVDSFVFNVDAATPATMLDFTTASNDDEGTAIGDAFDDIFAVSFASDTGAAMVFDDILLTV